MIDDTSDTDSTDEWLDTPLNRLKCANPSKKRKVMSDVSSVSDASDHSDDGSESDEPGPSEPGPSKAKPRWKRKALSAAVAAMQTLVTSVAAMTDRHKQVQVEWTKLRNASVDERGEPQVPGAGLLQAALGKHKLKVCTVCDTVKAAEKMCGKTSYCKLCHPSSMTGKARRANLHRRVAAARAALYKRHKDLSAIGARFEVWLLQQLRKAGFIVKLNYEFCRADLLLKRPGDALWTRIQCKGSEKNAAEFGNMFGYGSQAGGVVENDHRMLVVCGRKNKDDNAYTLWAMDGGEIPAYVMFASKAGVLASESLNLSSTTINKIVARIHADLEKKVYPRTTAKAAELDIVDVKQLKEKVLTLALHQCGVFEVKYPRGNQTCIDCYTVIDDDQWMAVIMRDRLNIRGFPRNQWADKPGSLLDLVIVREIGEANRIGWREIRDENFFGTRQPELHDPLKRASKQLHQCGVAFEKGVKSALIGQHNTWNVQT